MSRLGMFILLIALVLHHTNAYLSPMCCGDNFCCAVQTDATVDCWGGHSFRTVIPSSYRSESDLRSIKYVTCGGKTLVAVDAQHTIVAVLGAAGYGVDSFLVEDIGTVVRDVSVSFWGGSYIDALGVVFMWSQGDTYARSSSSQSWYPPSDSRGCQCTTSKRTMTLTAPSSTSSSFSMVACGGKRAGHFCCAVASEEAITAGRDTVQCFGDTNGIYTPTQAELSAQGLVYAPHSISAGCDFVCVLTSSGQLGVYTHASNQLLRYQSTWPVDLSLSSGLDLSGKTYVQAACGTFAVYALESGGSVSAYGRVFSSDVGPVSQGTDTTGTKSSFNEYVQRDSSRRIALLSANSGFGHACGVDDAGNGICWGADYSNQASRGNTVTLLQTSNVYPELLGRTNATTTDTASSDPSIGSITAAPTENPASLSPSLSSVTVTPTSLSQNLCKSYTSCNECHGQGCVWVEEICHPPCEFDSDSACYKNATEGVYLMLTEKRVTCSEASGVDRRHSRVANGAMALFLLLHLT